MKNRFLLLALTTAFALGSALVGCTDDDNGEATGTETESPTDTGDQPTDTGDQPTDTGDQPTDTGDQPTDTGDQPTDTGDQPTDTGDQPTDTGDQPTDTGDQPTDTGSETEVTNDCLVISEYIEGSSNNKGIELYNCGDAEIALDAYTLCVVGNDNTTCAEGHLELTGTLAAGSVYTICNGQLDTALYSHEDCDYVDDDSATEDGNVTSFNGDDRFDLQKNGVTVDAFGQFAVRPAPPRPWEDMTLRRCDLTPFLGDSEFNYYEYYNQYDKDDFDNFGIAPSETDECVGMPEDTDTQDTDTGTDTNDTDTNETDTNDTDTQDTDTGNEPVTIMDIQQETIAEGQVVTVENVVVTTPYSVSGNSIVVQDPTGGQYSGIFVFMYSEVVAANPSLKPGDVVRVTGEYLEYWGMSQIKVTSVDGLEVTGSQEVPAPKVVEAADIATGGSLAENYEGVLVKVENVTVTDIDPDAGGDKKNHFAVTDGLLVTEEFYEWTSPQVDDVFSSITGVMLYGYNNTKLAPRSADDMVSAR